MNRRLPLLLLLALTSLPAAAQVAPANDAEAGLVFRQAGEDYLAGNFAAARDAWQGLVDGGWDTADVFYNLGNAWLAEGNLGEAVVAYERALRRDPGHEDAHANLAAARRQNVDKVVGGAPDPGLLVRIGQVLPITWVGWGFLAAWLLLFGVLVLRVFAGGGLATLAAAGISGAIAGVLAIALGIGVWYQDGRVMAAVVQDSATVRKGPAPRFDAAFEVHDGLELRVFETDGPYQRVRLDNGLEGWIQRAAIRVI